MLDKQSACEKLLDTYSKLDLKSILGATPNRCNLNFTQVRSSSARTCLWEVKEGVLEADVQDTDIDSGVRMMIATFVRRLMVEEASLSIRYSILSSIIPLLLIVITPLILLWSYIYGYNELAIIIGIIGVIISPVLLFWRKNMSDERDRFFVSRISEVTDVDEFTAGKEYSYFLSKNTRVTTIVMLIASEFVFVFLSTFPILFPIP